MRRSLTNSRVHAPALAASVRLQTPDRQRSLKDLKKKAAVHRRKAVQRLGTR